MIGGKAWWWGMVLVGFRAIESSVFAAVRTEDVSACVMFVSLYPVRNRRVPQ